jgi:UDP-N-acetylglucosamine 2-epimerase
MKVSDRLLPRDLQLELLLDQDIYHRVFEQLEDSSLDEVVGYRQGGYPIGEICLPSLQWALRRTDLADDEPTRRLLQMYVASGASLVSRYEDMIVKIAPRACVIFNGTTYPEAMLKAVAEHREIPVISHEVGLRPFSAFFTHDHATFRAVDPPESFAMKDVENRSLDEYIHTRAQGRFSMAGIQFWPEMDDLPREVQSKIEGHKQMVTVFTNVIFDTSQIHANTVFRDMFDWLDTLLRFIHLHEKTLFVIRAHPDEDRAGKESLQSVTEWVNASNVDQNANVIFIPPSRYVSSYDLIALSKFVLVYNSSIGLEASILGQPVLCAGRARYTTQPTVHFPSDKSSYVDLLERMLDEEKLESPSQHRENARRLLYYELFHASLDFSSLMTTYPYAPGNMAFQSFSPDILKTMPEAKILAKGILEDDAFVYPVNSLEIS